MWDPSHLWRANEQPEKTLLQVKDHILAVRLRDHISRERMVDPAEIQVPGNGAIDFQIIVNELLTIEGLETFCIEINNWGHRNGQGQWVRWDRDLIWGPLELGQVLDILTRARQNLENFIRVGGGL
jgi:sugar phosphate isomerase/epimerase